MIFIVEKGFDTVLKLIKKTKSIRNISKDGDLKG